MKQNTEEIFKDIIANACMGLKAVMFEGETIKADTVQKIQMFLDDMDVNYFMKEPEGALQQTLKKNGSPISTKKAIEMLTKVMYDTYQDLKS